MNVSLSVVSDSLQPHRPPGSSVHGIYQARILEWVAISFSRGSFFPRIEPESLLSCFGRRILYTTESTGKPILEYAAAAAAAKLLQLCLTLCDPTDGSPPGSSVPGILQARLDVY